MSSTNITSQNIFWSIIVLLSVAAIALVGKLFLASFTMAIFLYYSSRPFYKEINKWIKQPTISAVITLTVTFVPLSIFTGYIIQLGYTELQRFLNNYNIQLQEIIAGSVEADIMFLLNTPTEIVQSEEGVAMIQELLDWSILVISFVGDIFLQVLVMIIILYYLLKHDDRLFAWASNNFSGLTDQWDEYWARVDNDLYLIYFGNILNGIIAMAIGILVAIVYSFIAPDVISIPFPILFGVVAGISSLIPIIGVKIAYVPVAAYLSIVAFNNDPAALFPYIIIFVLFSMIVLDFLQDLILRPYISGKHLHIGILLVAYISGPLLLGWYGFFFAPIVLVLIFHFADLILPELIGSWN